MNYLSKILVLLVLAGIQNGFSQGFVNLNFESAKIIPDPTSPYYPFGIAISNAVPGWAVFGSTQGDITYNDPAVGSSWVSLIATNGQQISGKYSVLLQGGTSSLSEAAISQTAVVPGSAESLLFEGQPGGGMLVVSLGGQDLSFAAVGTGSDYTLYEAALPAGLAGQSEQLEFTTPGGIPNNWNIDNIQFSPFAVPEPGTLALTALGGLFLAFRRWKNHSP
jgi:hypothetical protein